MMTDSSPLAPEAAELLLRTRSISYTPRRAEAAPLLDLYLRHLPPRSSAEKRAEAAGQAAVRADLLRGLDRVAKDALHCALLRVPTAKGATRRELFSLLARFVVLQLEAPDGREAIGAASPDRSFLAVLSLLHDDDAPAARQIAIVLGRAGDQLSPSLAGLFRRALLARLRAAESLSPADLRALVEALGKLPTTAADEAGLAETLSSLHQLASRPGLPDAVTAALQTAITRCERVAVRSQVSADSPAIALDRPLSAEHTLVLRCRAGLLPLLRSELRERGLLSGALVAASDPADTLGSYSPQTSGQPARLLLRRDGPLSEIYAARLFSSLAFELSPATASPAERAAPSDPELASAVVEALSAPATQRLLTTLCPGPVRYRLHLIGYGRGGAAEAALRARIIDGVKQRAPLLHNDPLASPFQVELSYAPASGLRIELVPRALQTHDPRFAYRQADVPAASHPPLAAAMARLLAAGARDVVWDPFVGSGCELIEVALLGRGPRLYGSDRDPEALAAAQKNLRAAGLPATQAQLQVADALTLAPPGVSRILTNPPMGRRTRPGQLAEFLSAFIAHSASLLPRGGRLVWISPQPHLSVARGREHGLSLRSTRPVDLNGFWGQLEVWDKLG